MSPGHPCSTAPFSMVTISQMPTNLFADALSRCVYLGVCLDPWKASSVHQCLAACVNASLAHPGLEGPAAHQSINPGLSYTSQYSLSIVHFVLHQLSFCCRVLLHAPIHLLLVLHRPSLEYDQNP